MSSKKNHGKKLPTDKNTDYLFDYFMNEDKFNDQMRGQWDEEMEKKLKDHQQQQPNLDSRIVTDHKSSKKDFSSSINEEELPSNGSESPNRNNNQDIDFNDDDSVVNDNGNDGNDNDNINDNVNSESSVKSIYGQKINAVSTKNRSNTKSNTRSDTREILSDRPLLGEKLVGDVQKYIETPEEKRARARDAYGTLQDLKEKYGITLTRNYTIDDDPDEMDAEIKMHKDRRHKHNQVKFYKQILLNIVCGVEFLNDKYNPFEFKLKDWSKQIAADMDDYTEVLEEIYEKYKDKGGKMAPEIRLLFMIIMSGVTFHLSQALFGSSGLSDTIQNNPNILNKLIGGLTKGGLLGGTKNEPEAHSLPNNKKILETIRKHNQNKQTETKSDNTNMTTEGQSESSQKILANNEALALERERRLLAEQKAAFEEQMRKQNEMYSAQMNDLRNQLSNKNSSPQIDNSPQPLQTYQQLPNNYKNEPVNQVLSDASKKPRFHENPLIFSNNQYSKTQSSEQLDIFDSEIKDTSKPSKSSKQPSTKKPIKLNYDELLDSLEKSSDVDLDDIIETSNKKKNRNSISKPSNIIKAKNNSATRSTTKKRGSESTSDILSVTKKNNIIKL